MFFNNTNNTAAANITTNAITNEVKTSIFQLCEFKESCDILCGYLLKEKKFFFTPIKCKLMNKSIRLTKIDDIDTNNELFTNFYNKLNEFKLNADQKIKQFDLELNKLETFHHQNNDNHHDDEDDVDQIQFNLKKKKPSIKKTKISHFSDLANIGRSFSSDTLNLKSNDLNNINNANNANNNNNNNNNDNNNNNSNNNNNNIKQQVRFKRNRYYSFKPKDKNKPTTANEAIKPSIIENKSETHNLKRSKSVDILN